ncbi:MAG TPA: GAF domain-containing sensor histidine kinase [Flavisolibacter sp.]|nr:GAF domain-containing sensor histidine kinase [Flavisolibacter sp.]
MRNITAGNTFAKEIIPLDDQQRIKALREFNLLDAPPDTFFQNIVHLAAAHFNVPIALISLVDQSDVYFRGNVGLTGVDQVSRSTSLCSLAVLSSEPTIFTKPLEEPCLINNPLVHKEFGLRFYAAAPLITSEGHKIGAVALVDKEERDFSETQKEQLVRFAQLVMHDMELRLSVQKRQKALKKEVNQRQKLVTNAVLAAQERERSRMGIELHDNVNQILTTVKLYNEMALDPSVNTAAILTKSNKYLQECINEIRFISKQLSATTLGEISLPDSVKELTESLNCSGKIDIKLNCELEGSIHISQELHTTIYRIIQEGLNNIIKHAKAYHAEVSLEGTADGIQLEIKDDGVGFDMTQKKLGMGLTNIRTRTENINGHLTIKSAKGKGCRLSLLLPYYSKN